MNNIYLLYNFNNYYNRKLIKYSTLSEYLNVVGAQGYLLFSNVTDFNFADGISTSHTFNMASMVLNPNQEAPDYMLVCDDSGTIQQRWFAIEQVYNRGGQYTISFYRDTVAEAKSDILTAPIFVEKGILPQSDPMILNSESMTFNQVKTTETELKDETACPWIVGYMTQDNVTTPNQDVLIDKAPDYEYTSLTEYPYYKYSNLGTESCPISLSATGNKFYFYILNEDGDQLRQLYCDGTYGMSGTWSDAEWQFAGNSLRESDATRESSFGYYCNHHLTGVGTAIGNDLQLQGDLLNAEAGKIIRVKGTPDTYYRVDLNSTTTTTSIIKRPNEDSDVFKAFDTLVFDAQETIPLLTGSSHSTYGCYKYQVNTVSRTITLTQIDPSRMSYKINHSRRRLTDQPYSMFCMPYGNLKIGGTTTDFKETSLRIATDIALKFGGSTPVIYDLQLLPYCPIRTMISGDGITLSGLTVGTDYDLITQNSTTKGYIFWATKSKDTFDINYTVSVTDYKIDNETKSYRLCSPNYQGQFEFSAAKNGGVTKFNVDFTYKPYNPYIHVNPNFSKLYGSDFDDARGLVCGGKFDLPQVSDAWYSYERSNANYNNIFNRKIESLEVQNKYQKVSDVASAIAGTLQAAGTGAAVGSAFGGAGAAIGAAAGLSSSALAGVTDVVISDKLREENMSLQKDLYGYNLGNIQAMPTSLTNAGSLTNNNKIFPFLEVYEATSKEVAALKDKVRYNGMTVGRIGTLSEFSAYTWQYSNGWNFFKGQLIRATIPGEDWHFFTVLKNELETGIFIEEA